MKKISSLWQLIIRIGILPAFEQAWQAAGSGGSKDVNRFEPNYEGSPVVFGPADGICSAKGSHQFKARAGHHLAPAMLTNGRNIYECLGDGFTLLVLENAGTVESQFTNVAQSLNMPLTIIHDTKVGDCARYEADCMLIRPDQFVAWAGSTTDFDAAHILKKAIGQ